MLVPQQAAPEFSLPNQAGEMIRLADFRGHKHVVLYFYPRDDTPGCTLEANQFTELVDEFARHDAVVIVMCMDSCESPQRFIN